MVVMATVVRRSLKQLTHCAATGQLPTSFTTSLYWSDDELKESQSETFIGLTNPLTPLLITSSRTLSRSHALTQLTIVITASNRNREPSEA
jgi:hypothetical protein